MTILDTVRHTIAHTLQMPVVDISETAHLTYDLGADDMDIMDIIVSLEDEFELSIPESAEVHFTTPSEITRFIGEKLADRHG